MHKRPYSLLVGVILSASIGCQGKISHEDHGQTLRESREAVAQAIERAYDNWYRGWETKDHELAARDYAVDAIWVNAFGMKRVGRAAIEATLKVTHQPPAMPFNVEVRLNSRPGPACGKRHESWGQGRQTVRRRRV